MRALGGLILVLAGLALGGDAGADEPRLLLRLSGDEPGTADLEAAQRAIQALEYPEAVNVLEALLRRGNAGPAVVARAYELLATAAASSGEEAQAVWAYERLLALHPDWRPPAELSPRLASALERARTELPGGAALRVRLQRPSRPAAGQPLAVTLVAASDALGLVRGARVRHRAAGGHAVSQVTVRSGAPVEVVVPATATTGRDAIDLWAAALDEHGNEIAWVGSADAPMRVSLAAASSVEHRPPTGRRTDEGGSVLGKWWFWTGVVVVVAGAAAVGLVLAQDDPDCPAQRSCFDVRVEAGGAAW